MKIELYNAMLVDPEVNSTYLGSIAINENRILAVGSDAGNQNPEIRIDCAGKCVAPGIVDIGVKICEPGERHKESFQSAGSAAVAGGITTMVTRPDTLPAIDNPETLEFFARRARASMKVRVRPVAALTKGREGRELSEISLLKDAGAVGFSDCDSVVEDTRVMSRCLHYCSQRGALVIGHPQDPGLSRGSSATSGRFASMKGLPAVSFLAEKMGLERDLALVELTGARYHADQLSTRAAVEVLARAVQSGLDVTAGVSIHHLTLNEMDIADFRTFFKVKPPLRAEVDRVAMVDAVADGTIKIISSMHTPQDEESKRLPFEHAASGAVALETLLPAALRLYHSGDLTLSTLFRALSLNPSRLLGQETGRLAAGAPADLVVFDPNAPFVLDRFRLRSKSRNTPFDGQLLQGKVLRTFVDGQEVFRASDEGAQ